jgi:hypothetical protein
LASSRAHVAERIVRSTVARLLSRADDPVVRPG